MLPWLRPTRAPTLLLPVTLPPTRPTLLMDAMVLVAPNRPTLSVVARSMLKPVMVLLLPSNVPLKATVPSPMGLKPELLFQLLVLDASMLLASL